MIGDPVPAKWWVLGAVGIGTLMSALDASVVNTMLPIISRGMGASVATIEWVVIAYLLVVSALLSAERGRALGLQAMMTYIGLTVGPALGGWLTSRFGWRSIFFINVPIGLAAAALGMRVIPLARRATAAGRTDVRGGALFAGGLTALLLALNQGHDWGWSSPAVIALLATAVVLSVAFIRVESRTASPMLDLGLFRNRVFAAATVSAVLNYVCAYCIVFVLPFYLIRGRDFSPERAGLVMTAQSVVMVVAAPLSGTLSDRIGSRLLSTSGLLLMGSGLLMLAGLGPSSPLRSIVFALAVVGLGAGLFTSPNNSALMGSAPRERQGVAAAVMATARNLGMVLGVGLAGAVFTSVMASLGPAPGALFAAARASFIAGAIVAVVGAGVSLIRGRVSDAR